MNLITPPPVKKGDTAYIISPSAGIMPFAQKRVERAIANLEQYGLRVVIAPNAAKNSGYVSASIQDRVADVHAAFSDENCSLILASIGGNHSNQIISKLDYELIKNNPKTFVGYSDNTVLHMALLTQASLRTYYGPCFLNQFGEYPDVLQYTKDYFEAIAMHKTDPIVKPSDQYTDEILDWFTGADGTRPRAMSPSNGWTWWRGGNASGWALPVTIPSINHIIGTKFMPMLQGAILMLDIPEGGSMHEGMSVSDVDSWLTDLYNHGVFSDINGLVIGRPYKYSDEMLQDLKNVVLRITEGLELPVLCNVDFGHTDPVLTIPYAQHIRLDSDTNTFAFA